MRRQINYKWAMFNSYVSLPEGKCDEHVIETESAPDIPKVDMSRSGFPRFATSNTRRSSSRNPVDEGNLALVRPNNRNNPRGKEAAEAAEAVNSFFCYMLHDEQNEPCHSPHPHFGKAFLVTANSWQDRHGWFDTTS